MEIFARGAPRTPVKAILFDFDGTISTLRRGWEGVMKPLMRDMLPDMSEREIAAYIDESTGIQTIHQMKWIAEKMRPQGDAWAIKAEYNRRLMESISKRLGDIAKGRARRDDYIVAGAEAFLRALSERGVKIFVASGTDHPDVVSEARALGLDKYFTRIAGAPLGVESCSKEAVMADLLSREGLSGAELAVIGDGKVEIALGKHAGARTIGMATDEFAQTDDISRASDGVSRAADSVSRPADGVSRAADSVSRPAADDFLSATCGLCRINMAKRARLIKASADVIAGDFTEIRELMEFLGLEA